MRTEDQNSTLGFPIFADDSSAIGAGKTGLTITATLAKNGGTASSVSPTITELGNGIYWVTPISAHRNTIGCNVWQFSATGAVIAPAFERIRVAPVVPGDAMALTSGERTTTATSIWENATRTLTTFPNVTVGAYATGQDPASFLSSTVTKVTSIDMLLTALTEVVDTVTRFKAAALSQAPSGGGAGDASQATLEDVQTAVNALGVALAGNSPVEPTGTTIREQLNTIQQATAAIGTSPLKFQGNVGDGGELLLTVGDDHETAINNDLRIRVADPGQTLYNELTAAGATLQWAAGQGETPAMITGTVGTPTHSNGITTVVVQVPNTPAAGDVFSPYRWQLQRTLNGKRQRMLKGSLKLTPDMIGS